MTTPDAEVTARVETGSPVPPPATTPTTPAVRGVDSQFAPGTIVAGRYRIASILGSGGMGEVYRAEDTKLGQAVALKFLPARLARDPVLLARLHDEVRLGRQVAHPNVCRTYDIAEWETTHFVAMEYVDGEDLSRLLRRIGRLAHDKAVDITRGIAAGLSAAHAKGILHRDLKPANVMVDSQGDARIMDFGLALAAGEDDGTISGTPAYMAPEQLAGQNATVQSDLYALGLVMYELFTGRRAHSARTLPERMRDVTSEIATPSSVVRDLDPAVERAILRCLNDDPSQRPRSAREVIEALPGGDPLAAALAAGETPSPRLVAAAAVEGSLKLRWAWSLLAVVLLAAVIAIAGKQRYGIVRYVAFDKSPEVLSERTSEILGTLGLARSPYSNHTYRVNDRYFGWIMANDQSVRRWERLRAGPPLVTFRHFESAEPHPPGYHAEPILRPGTTTTELDVRGRLVALTSLPQREPKERPLDWQPLFAAAGLDPKTLAAATPRLVPAAPADARAAWSGRHPDDGTPIHVEAAAWRGTPVYFRVNPPWERASTENVPFALVRVQGFATVLVVAALGVGLLLAWRNLRLRRGDRQGALRVAGVMLVLSLLGRLMMEEHYPSPLHELDVLQRSIADSLFWSVMMFVLYLALEPVVRRRWPTHLIASSRLLAGNYRDPILGRDVLVGVAAGVTHAALIVLSVWVSDRRQEPLMPPFVEGVEVLAGLRYGFGRIADALGTGMLHGFIFIIVLVMCMLLLRHRLLAALGLGAIILTGFYFAIGALPVSAILIAALMVFVAVRFGLLAIAVAQASFMCIFHYPLFANASWSSLNVLPVVVVLAAAIWAFRSSLGNARAFAGMLDD